MLSFPTFKAWGPKIRLKTFPTLTPDGRPHAWGDKRGCLEGAEEGKYGHSRGVRVPRAQGCCTGYDHSGCGARLR